MDSLEACGRCLCSRCVSCVLQGGAGLHKGCIPAGTSRIVNQSKMSKDLVKICCPESQARPERSAKGLCGQGGKGQPQAALQQGLVCEQLWTWGLKEFCPGAHWLLGPGTPAYLPPAASHLWL